LILYTAFLPEGGLALPWDAALYAEVRTWWQGNLSVDLPPAGAFVESSDMELLFVRPKPD
jgi:hypothetical protein